jgi:hypothetical protein
MVTLLQRIFGSTGLKRLIASLLAVLYGLSSSIPGLNGLTGFIEMLAAAIGGVGVVHAVSVKSLSKSKLAGLSSILSILMLIAQYIPALHPYEPLIKQLAELLGAAAVGSSIAVATVAK